VTNPESKGHHVDQRMGLWTIFPMPTGVCSHAFDYLKGQALCNHLDAFKW